MSDVGHDGVARLPIRSEGVRERPLLGETATRRAIASLAFGAALLVAGVATATPGFPGTIQQDLSLSYTPSCSLCHQNGIVGAGTVTTPFGQNMLVRGLVAFDAASVADALKRLGADQADSDGDGVPDVEELVAETDPNGPGGGAPLGTGCGAQMSPVDPSTLWPACVLALLGVSLRRRRPGQPPPSRT